MKNFKLEVIKILAVGCNYRYMTIHIPYTDFIQTIRISDKLYWSLRELGVPTSQKLSVVAKKNK